MFNVTGVKAAYFDTNALIYFIEYGGDLQQKVANLYYALLENDAVLYTSEMAISECFYGVYKQKSTLLEEKYAELFFENDSLAIIPLSLSLMMEASKIGATNRLKLIDASHLQASLLTNCDIFITNDAHFKSQDLIKVVMLSDL